MVNEFLGLLAVMLMGTKIVLWKTNSRPATQKIRVDKFTF